MLQAYFVFVFGIPHSPAARAAAWRRGWLLLRLAVRHQHLSALNAYISTLGGGHFMCKHLDAARALAEQQVGGGGQCDVMSVRANMCVRVFVCVCGGAMRCGVCACEYARVFVCPSVRDVFASI